MFACEGIIEKNVNLVICLEGIRIAVNQDQGLDNF